MRKSSAPFVLLGIAIGVGLAAGVSPSTAAQPPSASLVKELSGLKAEVATLKKRTAILTSTQSAQQKSIGLTLEAVSKVANAQVADRAYTKTLASANEDAADAQQVLKAQVTALEARLRVLESR